MIEVASDTGSSVSVNTRIRFLRAFDMRRRNSKTSCSTEKRMQGEKRAATSEVERRRTEPNLVRAELQLARSLVGVLEQEC
jgi:hypothetical protein